jgi:hypothetical protein
MANVSNPRRAARTVRSLTRALALLLVLSALGPVACHDPLPPPAQAFEDAEARLREGDYDGATRLYQTFLASHPHSPLAPIARQRLRNIDRELEAVMGRRATPAPIYIRPELAGDDVSNR